MVVVVFLIFCSFFVIVKSLLPYSPFLASVRHRVPQPPWLLALGLLQGSFFFSVSYMLSFPRFASLGFLSLGQFHHLTTWSILASVVPHAEDPQISFLLGGYVYPVPVDLTGFSKVDTQGWIFFLLLFYLILLTDSVNTFRNAPTQTLFDSGYLCLPLYPATKSYQVTYSLNILKLTTFLSIFISELSLICLMRSLGLTLSFYISHLFFF